MKVDEKKFEKFIVKKLEEMLGDGRRRKCLIAVRDSLVEEALRLARSQGYKVIGIKSPCSFRGCNPYDIKHPLLLEADVIIRDEVFPGLLAEKLWGKLKTIYTYVPRKGKGEFLKTKWW